MTRRIALVLAALLFAVSAHADAWNTKRLRPSEHTAIYTFTSADSTGFSKVLGLGCTPDITIHKNTSGSASSAAVRFWATILAPDTTVTTSNGLTPLATDVDGDGVQDLLDPLDGSANKIHVKDHAVSGIVVERVTAAGSGETPAVEVTCR